MQPTLDDFIAMHSEGGLEGQTSGSAIALAGAGYEVALDDSQEPVRKKRCRRDSEVAFDDTTRGLQREAEELSTSFLGGCL